MIFLKSQDCVFQVEILRHVSARCEFGEVGQVTPLPPPPNPPLEFSVARLPGRNSGQKAQKGPQTKKFLAEFWLILPKTGRKGAAENIQKMFLIFSCDNCDKFDF